MIFFKFISLSKIFVACILIISAMPSSAQQFRNRSTALSELWGFLVEACYPQLRIFKLIKGQKTPELYLFLKEAQGPDIPKYQHPPDQFQKIFENYTTSPIKNSYLGYCKLHNTSLPPPAIAWDRMILHIHKDNKVTGWILGSSETTYNTVRTSDDITDAFLGEVANNKIQFHRVTEEGKAPKDGREEYYLTWKPASSVIAGTWKGCSKNATPKEQEGDVYIDMHSHNYCEFDLNKELISKFKRDSEKWNKESIREKEKNIASLDDIKLVIAWYIVKAWEAYESYLPEHLKKDIDIRVALAPQFYSFNKFNDNGEELRVPMQSAKLLISKKYILRISTKTFFSDELEDEKTFKSKLSLIAHEILGHGIFYREYDQFLNAEKDNFFTIFMKQFVKIKEKRQIISEGLAVAVEYAVYKSSHKNLPSKIEDFTKIRYSSDNGEMYRDGVTYLKKKGIITTEGKLDFDKLDNLNRPEQTSQTK